MTISLSFTVIFLTRKMDMLIPVALARVVVRQWGPHGSSSWRVLAVTLCFRIGTLGVFPLRHTIGWADQSLSVVD